MNQNERAKFIAFYLPQYYPTPQNDEWWGRGFTEWTNVTRARPLYPGHYQPNLPSELGFYDLRVLDTHFRQYELAEASGIYGFCYWHYWFGGTRLLEKPVELVLGETSLPTRFCLAWANESWSGVWHGSPNRILQAQEYPGEQDHVDHFNYLFRFFSDPRHIRVQGKPLFVILRPHSIPGLERMVQLWQKLAMKQRLPGIHFVGVTQHMGVASADEIACLDGMISGSTLRYAIQVLRKNNLARGAGYLLGRPVNVIPYRKAASKMHEDNVKKSLKGWYPVVYPNWDNTPRLGKRGTVLSNPHPVFFGDLLRKTLSLVSTYENKLIFIKSWNEWAEGNFLEPSVRYGREYLDQFRSLSRPTYRSNRTTLDAY